jgi:3-oxoacyl-[acyl-carrier-protein] synthase-3
MAYLRAFGSWLPPRRVSNEELAPLVGATPEWILESTGILERRYAEETDTVAGSGILAAKDCLEKAGAAAAEVGLILVASGSSARYCPGPASGVAAGLGLSDTPAIDIPVASCGSLIGLVLAAQLASHAGLVLVVGAEIMSRCVQRTPEGKDTAILFGDGAGACLVDAKVGFACIADFSLHTDGAFAGILTIEQGQIHMDGRSVILQACRKVPRVINELLERNRMTAADPGVYLLHQANANLIARVAASLKVSEERFFTNLARYGNTSAASLLIAVDEWHSKQTAPFSAPMIMSAFGAGLNWGALLAFPTSAPSPK